MSERALEVAVVGGGPAGAACAIALARTGRSVVLIDRGRAPRPGDTALPAIQPALVELGIWDRFVGDGHLPCSAVESAWAGTATTTHAITSPFGPGWHLDRVRFDRLLRDTAAATGVELRAGVVTSQVTVDERGAHLALRDGTIDARIVVDATGRTGRVAPVERRHHDRLIAAQAIYRIVDPEPVLSVEPAPIGWWYAAPLSADELVVVLLTDADQVPTADQRPAWFAAALAATTGIRMRAGARLCRPLQLFAAHTACLRRAAGPGWVAVGDAARAYDPLSGSGIAHALRDGLTAAGAVHAALDGDASAMTAYADQVAARFARYLGERATYYGRETRWPAAPFWRRRAPVIGAPPPALAT